MTELNHQSKMNSASAEKDVVSSRDGKNFSFVDNRPQAVAQRKLVEAMSLATSKFSVQRKTNNTGLPDQLKSGIENISGYSMDDVKVHYNSGKPAQLNAHAYAQGTDIHVASGQEKHIAHEAWHVVQQKQGRVKPTMQMKNKVNVNDDHALEKEADVMGGRAMDVVPVAEKTLQQKTITENSTLQAKWAGLELETLIPIYKDGQREDHVDGYMNQPGYEHTDVVPGISKELGERFEIHVDSSQFSKNNALATCHFDGKPKIMEIVTPPRASPDENKKDLEIVRAFLANFGKHASVNRNGWNIGWPTAKAGFTPPGKSEVTAQVLNENFALDAKQTNPFEYHSQVTYQNDIETLGVLEDQYTKKGVYDTGLNEKVTELKPGLLAIIMKCAPKTKQPDAARLAIIVAKMLSDTLYFLDGGVGTIKNAVATLIRSDLRSMYIYLDTEGSDRATICTAILQQFVELAGTVIPVNLAIDNRSSDILKNQQHGEGSNVNAAIKTQVAPKGKRDEQTVAGAQILKWWSAEVLKILIGPDKTPAVTGPLKGDRELAELQRDNIQNPMVVYEVRGGWSGDLDKGFEKSVSSMMEKHTQHNFIAPQKGKILMPVKADELEKGGVEHKMQSAKDSKDVKSKQPEMLVAAVAAPAKKSPAQNLAILKTALGTAAKGAVFTEKWETIRYYFEQDGGDQAAYMQLIYDKPGKTVINGKNVVITSTNIEIPMSDVTIKVE